MVDAAFKEQVAAYVDEVWEDVVADIAELVSIESVEDLNAAEPGKPWGPASYEALACALRMAERLGLDAHDCEGYIGYADLAGASATQIATIAHTDVVPLGEGWTVPPLQLTRRDGYLLGRGVIDDKGPFVLSLYAAHFFARQVERTGKRLPYTLRCIIGNDEETSMADVDWYLEHYEAPAFCFSPDADFPLICGEKGIFHGLFRSRPGAVGTSGLIDLDAGTAVNAIPGKATARVAADAADFLLTRCTPGISSETRDDGSIYVEAHGIGGHAAFPEGTDNAIGKLVRLMLEDAGHFPEGTPTGDFLRLVEMLTRTSDGSACGVDAVDEVFGALTMNAGVLRSYDDGSCTISLDVRYPTSTDEGRLLAAFEGQAARFGCAYEHDNTMVPFYMDPSLPEIRTLLDVAKEYRGTDEEPLVIGGGTYARHFPRACSFGPHDPRIKDPDWVGTEHGPDEGVSEEALRRALQIYIVSIARLMELDLG